MHKSDIKGFSGLHKLINGIPYDAPDHQGWTAVRRYIKYKEDAGTIAQELEEYQNKTTPMLMAACECLAYNILIQIINFHGFDSFLTCLSYLTSYRLGNSGRKPPLDIVETFVELCPECLNQKHGRYQGMVPIHFACKFVASKEVIQYLIHQNPECIILKDKGDRTPIHCMLNNFENTMPSIDVLNLLLHAEGDDGSVYSPVAIQNTSKHTPLQYLVTSLNSIDPNDPDDAKARRNAAACVDAYCSQITPDADAMAIFTEIAAFPPWLIHRLMRHRPIQRKLDILMAQSYNIEVIVADLAVYIMIVVVYYIQAIASLDAREAALEVQNTKDARVSNYRTYILYVCSAYLLIRQMAKIYRCMKLKLLVRYVSIWSLIDLSNAALLLASSIHIHLGTGDDDKVKTLYITTAFTVFLMLACFLGRGVSYRFSVFLGGVVDILWALLPFFVAMGMAIASFGLAYALDGHTSTQCVIRDYDEGETFDQATIRSTFGLSFCTVRDSILKVYSMFVTRMIDEEDFISSGGTMAISILFGIISLILLFAALIASATRALMKTDEDRAVFYYSHRYYLLNELEQIYHLRPGKIKSKKQMDTRDTYRQMFWDMLWLSWSDPQKLFARNKRKKLDEMWKEKNGWKWVRRAFLGNPDEREKVPIWRRFLCLFALVLWFPLGIATLTKLFPISARLWLSGTDQHHAVEDDLTDDVMHRKSNEMKKAIF